MESLMGSCWSLPRVCVQPFRMRAEGHREWHHFLQIGAWTRGFWKLSLSYKIECHREGALCEQAANLRGWASAWHRGGQPLEDRRVAGRTRGRSECLDGSEPKTHKAQRRNTRSFQRSEQAPSRVLLSHLILTSILRGREVAPHFPRLVRAAHESALGWGHTPLRNGRARIPSSGELSPKPVLTATNKRAGGKGKPSYF